MRRFALGLAACVGAGLGLEPAEAGSVYINSPNVTIDATLDTAGNAKYRLSNLNFDQSIDNGNTPVTAPDQVTAALGNVAFLSGRQFAFTLSHTAGEGFVFNMTDGAGADKTVSWGTFAVPPPGTNAPTLNGLAPGAPFNALLLEAVASRAHSSMSFSDLSFSGTGLTIVDGAFVSGTVSPTSTPPNNFTQVLYADVDLASFDWMLSGKVTGVRDGSGGDETVKFVISQKLVSASVVPEPASVAMAATGLGVGLVLAIRRRARRTARA